MQKEDLRSEDLALDDIDEMDDGSVYNDFEAFDDDDEESVGAASESDYDDELIDDDESDDFASDDEFLPALAGLAAPALISGGINAIRGLIRSRGRRRFRGFSPMVPGTGVRGATIRTPRGTANLRLPTALVPMETYRRDIARLNARDNGLNSRINQTQSDLAKTEKKASQALGLATQNGATLTRVRKVHGRRLRALRHEQRRQFARLRREQSSQATMSLLMGMMQTQQVDTAIRTHTHAALDEPAQNLPPINNAMMFLPLMLGDTGGKSDDTMMMVMMMMMMSQQQPRP